MPLAATPKGSAPAAPRSPKSSWSAAPASPGTRRPKDESTPTARSVDAARAKALQSGPIPRTELVARLDVARRDPRFATPVAMMFRKKSAEESTDDELRAMLEEIEFLAKSSTKS